jgi:hypothetical protein
MCESHRTTAYLSLSPPAIRSVFLSFVELTVGYTSSGLKANEFIPEFSAVNLDYPAAAHSICTTHAEKMSIYKVMSCRCPRTHT